jgi:hypothetical protein
MNDFSISDFFERAKIYEKIVNFSDSQNAEE